MTYHSFLDALGDGGPLVLGRSEWYPGVWFVVRTVRREVGTMFRDAE